MQKITEVCTQSIQNTEKCLQNKSLRLLVCKEYLIYYTGVPHSVQASINSHQVELQSFLDQFDRFLPRAETSGGRDQRGEPTLAEYEAMWEVIADDDVMVMSLERIHNALVGCCSLVGHGFNPQGEYNNVPTMEIVDNIDWKGNSLAHLVTVNLMLNFGIKVLWVEFL